MFSSFNIDVGMVRWPPAWLRGHALCSSVAIYLCGLVCSLAVRFQGHQMNGLPTRLRHLIKTLTMTLTLTLTIILTPTQTVTLSITLIQP